MNRTQEIAGFKKSLPARVSVKVENIGDGLWAKISTPDGTLSNCYTQASNAVELVTMVNDAIFTHFEIPEEIRSEIGYYVPLSEAHIQWEEMFDKLVSMEKQLDLQGGSETTLTLKEAIC